MNTSPSNPVSRVLVIDDNASIHADFKKILGQGLDQDSGLSRAKALLFGEDATVSPYSRFLIDSAFQGREGLEMVQRAMAANDPYALAFVDIRMPPGWDGVETICHLWKCCPELQVIICTAYSDYSWEDMVRKLGHSANLAVLKKPFDNVEVLQLAHALTEKWRLSRQIKCRLNDLDSLVRQRTEELETANAQLKEKIAKQQKLEAQLRHSQRMEAVGQLAAGVAHDFNNILTVIQGNVSLLQEQIEHEPSSAESLTDIATAAERAARLVRQLLAFSRKQVLRSETLNLDKVVNNMAEMLKRLVRENISLELFAAPALPPIQADLSIMEQIIMNLSVNARDAMPDGGKLTVRVEAVNIGDEDAKKDPRIHPGQYVCLSVSDTGRGIPREHLPRIFDPFFTTKEVGKGTGLGLATVYGIVKQHDGWVDVQSVVNQGSTLRVFLPASDRHSPAKSALQISAPPQKGTECILVVDDEDHLRMLAATVLRKNGYQVLEAASSQEALEVFQNHSSEVKLLFTDVMMPGSLLGDELAAQMMATKPSLAVLLMSGYTPKVGKMKGRLNGNFLAKPFAPVEMLAAVRRCLDQAPADGRMN